MQLLNEKLKDLSFLRLKKFEAIGEEILIQPILDSNLCNFYDLKQKKYKLIKLSERLPTLGAGYIHKQSSLFIGGGKYGGTISRKCIEISFKGEVEIKSYLTEKRYYFPMARL